MEAKKKILLVDDDVFSVMLMKSYFGHFGFNVTILLAFDAESAISTADAEVPDLVIMDILLADGMSGITAAEIIKARHKNTAIVFITSCSDAETRSMTAKASPLAFIGKPADLKELLAICRDHLALNKTAPDKVEFRSPKVEHARL
jgi:DNA-binding response OmpR family regulator